MSEQAREVDKEVISDSAADEAVEDKYKDYYTTNIFEGLKKANPKVLIVIGVVAVVLVVMIILIFGGKQASAKEVEPVFCCMDRVYGIRDVLLYDTQTVAEKDYQKTGGSRRCFHIGDTGLISFAAVSKYDKKKNKGIWPSVVRRSKEQDPFANAVITYTNSNPDVIQLNEETHTYHALSGGTALVTLSMEYHYTAKPTGPDGGAATGSAVSGSAVSGSAVSGSAVSGSAVSGSAVSGSAVTGSAVTGSAVEKIKTVTASFLFIVGNDTSYVTVDNNVDNVYILNEVMTGRSDFVLGNLPDLKYMDLSCSASDGTIPVSVSINKKTGVLSIYIRDIGIQTVTVNLNNRSFVFVLNVITAPINCSSKVMEKGDDLFLVVKKYPGEIVWYSTDEKVATVDEDGWVTAKGIGNAIIYADIEGFRTGCIVSVVNKGIAKVVKIATWIGDNWSYSQPKRMRRSYYDCSSLVWKAYRQSGRYVCGSRWVAPVAASIGRWGVVNKKYIGKFRESKIKELYYLPGDLLLKVRMRSDRYKGIGHIEMITGYSLHGFDGEKPVLFLTWGARDEGYGATRKDDFVIRPYN